MAATEGVGSLRPLLALTRMEWRIGWRTIVFRMGLVVAFIFGWSVGAEPGRGVALSAYSAADAASLYLGFFAIVWMSLAAVREAVARTDMIVFSKPQPSEWLALSKFLGSYLQILVMLLALFLGAIAGRGVNGGLIGAPAYVLQYLRAAVALLFASASSFMLALLLENALAGMTLGLFWLLTVAGKAFLGKYYFPAYSQNQGAYIALSLALLFTTLILYRRNRRGSVPVSIWVRVGAPLMAFACAWQFYGVIQYGHDPDAHLNPAMERMADQDSDVGRRASGFLLPDQNGRLIGLSDFDGKILVIALWSPHDPDSALLLDRLNEVQARFSAQGVQPIGVAISEDTGAAATFAIGEALRYPVVEDWGTFNAPKNSDISPIASAYRSAYLPKVIVTDRRRRVRTELNGIESYDGSSLLQLIQDRLADEPR